jgi:hypothetical protein
MALSHDLISCWRSCNLTAPPYLFPDDVSRMANSDFKVFQSFDGYVASKEFGLSSDTSLHAGLLPLPFVGNLENASVFILMLNPGLSAGDYFAEQNSPEFRNTCIRNLRQENGNDDYPFVFLNPQFAWHPGFGYWHKKLDDIIEKLARQSGMAYQEAMSKLAKNLTCLELIPYHSKSFGSAPLLNILPSVSVMLSFVHEILIPKAEDDKVVIIATRSVKNWRLPEHENIITYEGGETRSAHLSLTSRGGVAIANRLGL